MLGSIYIGLSGMNAYSKGLQTISNNVSNLNASGFKSTIVSFEDLSRQGGGMLGSSSSIGSQNDGYGVRIGNSIIDFGQGELRQTENDLDLAIKGSGFFVLLKEGQPYYSRTGQFAVDKDGYLAEQGSEYRLGVIGAGGQPVELNVNGKRTSAPVATTQVVFSDNLSSSGTEATVSNIAVYDSAGEKQVWTVLFARNPDNGATGEWSVTVKDSNGDVIGTSTLRFFGSIVDPATAQLVFTDAPENADPLSVTLDFSTGVTSYSMGTTSTLRASSVDGNAAGSLAKLTVDEDGKIKLTYSNEKTEQLGAVALANFRDPQQLERFGNGIYQVRGSEGPQYFSSGADGLGVIISRRIEASNVDLSAEFGNLILVQRGFQASSQVVSISNDMIQQLFGMRGQG